MEKEFLYIGYYIDTNNNFILKIGTTNDLKRRATEHTRNYKRATNYTMPKNSNFEYIWTLPLSKYNTLRYEDKTIDLWKEMEIGTYIRNDRFVCSSVPSEVVVKIRKEYIVKLPKEAVLFLLKLPIDKRGKVWYN